MSFSELSINIVAQNLASAEFSRVARDAGVMASEVTSQRVELNAENYASAEINQVAADAARVKAEVEAEPITINFEPVAVPEVPEIPPLNVNFEPIEVPEIPPIEAPEILPIEPPEIPEIPPLSISFEPIEAPEIPPVDTSSLTDAQAAFQDVGVSAMEMGENIEAASGSLSVMSTQAESCTVKLTTFAGGLRSTSIMGTQLISLAADFGIVDRETSKYLRTITLMISLVATAARVYNYLSVATTGHSASVAVNTAAQTANTSQSLLSAAAYKVKAAATWVAVSAQNALNISHATFLALTGVGIGVVIAAAAAMAYFASQMNAATSSVQSFNAAASETPTRTRSIQRAGEEDFYRRGVE